MNNLHSARGGDFGLHAGEGIPTGCLGHDDMAIRLYPQETFTFLPLTSAAAVALAVQ